MKAVGLISVFLFHFCKCLDSKPNIILFLADDLGYNDIGYHNTDVISPNIDALAKSGVILERSYTEPVCTPSRSALMTGMYPFHIGRQGAILGSDVPTGLTLERPFLADGIKSAGYNTHAVGKWHIGHCSLDYLPNQRGFDSYLGYWQGSTDYYTKSNRFYDFHDDNDIPNPKDTETYTLTLYQHRITQILRSQNEVQQPLFLYVPMQTVHSPLQVPKEFEDMYPGDDDDQRRKLLGMVSAMDSLIGNLTQELKDNNLYENTIFIFISDNGGALNEAASNLPLREGKGTVYEGGIRTPSFVHSPLLKLSEYVSEKLIHISDWYPTLLKLAGAENYEELTEGIDGLDQSEVVFGDADIASPRQSIASDLNERKGKKSGALHKVINDVSWKLLVNAARSPSIDNVFELFNLSNDPTESNNLMEQEPDLFDELLAEFQAIHETMVPMDIPEGVDDDLIHDSDNNLVTGWC